MVLSLRNFPILRDENKAKRKYSGKITSEEWVSTSTAEARSVLGAGGYRDRVPEESMTGSWDLRNEYKL